MQRAPPAQTEGAGQDRERGLGAQDAAFAPPRLSRLEPGAQRDIALSARFIALTGRCYDAILAEGLAFHAAQPALASTARKRQGRKPRRVGHNLLLRLQTRNADALGFLSDPEVPFTKNLEERDGRMMKLRQKISGGFRSCDGADDFGVIRSLISTAR